MAESQKGTSLETIESQRQPDLLFQNLANCRRGGQEKRGHRAVRQTIAVFDLAACSDLVPACTQSVFQQTAGDEDMSDLSHVSKAQKREGLKANRLPTMPIRSY